MITRPSAQDRDASRRGEASETSTISGRISEILPGSSALHFRTEPPPFPGSVLPPEGIHEEPNDSNPGKAGSKQKQRRRQRDSGHGVVEPYTGAEPAAHVDVVEPEIAAKVPGSIIVDFEGPAPSSPR